MRQNRVVIKSAGHRKLKQNEIKIFQTSGETTIEMEQFVKARRLLRIFYPFYYRLMPCQSRYKFLSHKRLQYCVNGKAFDSNRLDLSLIRDKSWSTFLLTPITVYISFIFTLIAFKFNFKKWLSNYLPQVKHRQHPRKVEC